MLLNGKNIFSEEANEYINECFDTQNENYKKMINILEKDCCDKIYEEHHVIPKCFFKKKKIKIINKNNIAKLTLSNHFKVHYYAWKCSKDFIRKELACDVLLLLNSKEQVFINESILEEISLEYETLKKQYLETISKKIICLETKEIFSSIQEAEKEKKCYHIYRVLNGERKIAGGYHWEYFNPEIEYTDLYISLKTKKEYHRPNYHKQILCIETNEIFYSLAEANRHFNFKHKTSISNQLRGLSKSCEGYHFKYLT